MRSAISRPRAAAAAGAAISALALMVSAQPAAAAPARPRAPIPPELNFSDCPKKSDLPAGADPALWLCSPTVIGGGRLKMGRIDQAINQPLKLTWANGFDAVTLEEKFVFGPLRAQPIRVAGGVLGIPGTDVLPILQIRALPQLAAPPEISPKDAPGVAIRLKLKVKVLNPLLGNACYIGSAKTPITLNLIFGTTNPPPPNKPITGKGIEPHPDDPSVFTSTVVDNAFAVPRASGCGPHGLLNPVANLRAGLPAKAGTNTAIFDQLTTFKTYAELPDTKQRTNRR